VRSAAKYAGTWEGRSFVSPADTGIPWTSTSNVAAAGTLSGTVTFTGSKLPPVAIQMFEITDSTAIQDIGPYTSLTSKAEVMTRVEGRVAGDSAWGTFVTLPTQGGLVTPGMSSAQWKNFEVRPTAGNEPVRGTFVAKRRR
jgi:hypothetical protein